MRAGRIGWLAGGAAAIALMTGCGLDIEIMGSTTVTAGQTATYTVKLTNTSVCPLANTDTEGEDLAVIPLIPAAVIEDEDLLAFFCNLTSLPPPARSNSLASTRDISVDEARATLSAALAAAQAEDAQCSGTGISCMTTTDEGFDGVICDLGDPFAPGEMRTLSCSATVPSGGGPFYTLAIGGVTATGVCTNATAEGGDPCTTDGDCGMGGACGTGICVGGSNAGFGCDADGECPDEGVCTDCLEGQGLGLACLEQAQPVTAAPSLAPWGLAAAVLGLAAVGLRRLRRR